MMGGTGDPRMFDRLNNSVMSETLKKAFVNISLDLVPYMYSISFEGTVGITIDNQQILFLHFSDTLNKSPEDDAVGPAVQSSPRPTTRNSTCSRRSLSNEVEKISAPVASLKGQSESTDSNLKNSSLRNNVHQIQSAYFSEDTLVQSGRPEYLAVAEACLDLEKSTAARRKGRPAKFPSDGVKVFSSAGSNQVSNGCPVAADEETDVSPQAVQSYCVELDESEVLDFSARSKVELFKRKTPGFSDEDSKFSGLQTGVVDDEIESAQMKEKGGDRRDQRDRTLLRQLLLNNMKTKKAKPIKRRLSGSDDYSNKKISMEMSSCINENSKIGSSGLLPEEPDAIVVGAPVRATPSLRSSTSKKTEVRSTDNSGGERRANPDSILCRLLTSGVNMYDTTEIERLRQVAANKLKVTSDQDVSGSVKRNTMTTDQLGSTTVDIVLTNIKTERESCIRTDELVSNAPVEPTGNSPLYFQSNVRCHSSNSPLGTLPRSGLGPLRSLPDAAVTVPPQFQNNCYVADQCLGVVKEERDDSVDVHRMLHASAANNFPSDAQTKENLYKACFTK